MPHAFSPRAQHSLPTGLQALLELINDAVAYRVTPLPAGMSIVHTAVNTPQRRTGHLGRPSPTGRRPVPQRAAPPLKQQQPEPHDIDDSHAGTWELVQRAQSGDGEAFGRLYDLYVDTVFKFIYYRVNDRALAEDFTSETFLRALRRIGSFSYQGRDVGAWFVTIARNIVLDHVKSARYRLEVTTAEHPESKEHEASTETAVLASLQSEQLLAAVARLGEEQRECITLRFLQGLSVSETAAAMGKNDGAIKALQHRAVRKLAELLGGELR